MSRIAIKYQTVYVPYNKSAGLAVIEKVAAAKNEGDGGFKKHPIKD